MDTRYVNIKESFGSDGLGVPSVSIYFAYCDKKDITGKFCKGCHNKELQVDGVGYKLTLNQIISMVEKKAKYLEKTFKKCRIVFLGGEPTAKINYNFTYEVAKYFKNKFETVLYTWKNENMLEYEFINAFDLIVCGDYNEDLKVENYELATSNQYVINNKKIKEITYDN